MSRLAELIEELCPDGVEYRPLGELGSFFGGLSGKTKSDFVEIEDARPFVTYREVYSLIEIDRCPQGRVLVLPHEKQLALCRGDVLFTGSSENADEVGLTAVVTTDFSEPVYLNSFSICLRWRDATFDSGYAKYLFTSSEVRRQIRRCASGVTRFNLSKKRLEGVSIPVPPMEVQREIARILDQFTTLEAELEAELEARRAQYEHYRNHLLSYESLAARGPVEMVKLGAVSRISAGYGFPKSEQGCSSGEYPFYKVSDMNHPGNQVFLEGASNYLSGPDIRRLKMTPFPAGAIVFPKIGAAIATNKKRILSCLSLVDNNVAVCIPEGVDGKYLYYWLLEQDLRFVAHDSGAVPSIRKTDLEQLDVPVPSVAEQERIVEVLDRFNALVNEISAGLPAEIAARRAQYEHYRDRLLSFPEKKAE